MNSWDRPCKCTELCARAASVGTNRKQAQMGLILEEEMGLSFAIAGRKVTHVVRRDSL